MAAVNTPEPATPPPAGNADEGEIRELVAQFERALETHDSGLPQDAEARPLRQEQDALKRSPVTDVNITMGPIQMQGEKATVMVARADRADGKTFNIQQTLILSKKGGRWVIQKIVSQQVLASSAEHRHARSDVPCSCHVHVPGLRVPDCPSVCSRERAQKRRAFEGPAFVARRKPPKKL
jgi:hypothetical protein